MCFRVDGIYVFIHLHSTTYPAHIDKATSVWPASRPEGPGGGCQNERQRRQKRKGKQRTTVTKGVKRKGRMKWCWGV